MNILIIQRKFIKKKIKSFFKMSKEEKIYKKNMRKYLIIDQTGKKIFEDRKKFKIYKISYK